MRRIIVVTFTSLDGVMQAPGGPEEDRAGGFAHGGWMVPYADDVIGERISRIRDRPFELLLGRVTYDIFAAHWPYAPEDDPIAKSFNAVTKHVATHRPETLAWRNSQALGADVVGALRELKASGGPDLVVHGSGGLVQTLLANDLIDELHVLTFPLVLGRGKRLFGDGAAAAALKLTGSQVSTTGVVMATYERAGELTTGSFALAEPSAAEIERRKRIAG